MLATHNVSGLNPMAKLRDRARGAPPPRSTAGPACNVNVTPPIGQTPRNPLVPDPVRAESASRCRTGSAIGAPGCPEWGGPARRFPHSRILGQVFREIIDLQEIFWRPCSTKNFNIDLESTLLVHVTCSEKAAISSDKVGLFVSPDLPAALCSE